MPCNLLTPAPSETQDPSQRGRHQAFCFFIQYLPLWYTLCFFFPMLLSYLLVYLLSISCLQIVDWNNKNAPIKYLCTWLNPFCWLYWKQSTCLMQCTAKLSTICFWSEADIFGAKGLEKFWVVLHNNTVTGWWLHSTRWSLLWFLFGSFHTLQ